MLNYKSIAGCLIAFAALLVPGAAAAAYPDKPVQFVAPYPPGGSLDIVTRLLAKELESQLGQPFVVENRSGASGGVGTAFVAQSAPDGYTILMAAPSLISAPLLNPDLPFDPKELRPVVWVVNQPNVLLLHPSVPANTVTELISYAKEHPDKLSYGSYGIGTSQHLATELFISLAGVKMVHVPYARTSALMDLVGGQLDLMIDAVPTSLPHLKSHKLKALAVTTAKRSPMLPDVPTMSEAGLKGYEFHGFNLLAVPAGTPDEVVKRLNAAVNEALQKEHVRKRLTELGLEIVGGTTEDAEASLRTQRELYSRILGQPGTGGQ